MKGSPVLQLCDGGFGVTAEGIGDDREAQQLDAVHVACQVRPGELVQLVPALGMQPGPGQAQNAISLAGPVYGCLSKRGGPRLMQYSNPSQRGRFVDARHTTQPPLPVQCMGA